MLARHNAGNAALLGHGLTGVGQLFETADELVQKAEELLADAALGARLTQAAAEHVARHHSAHAETAGYGAALQLALDSPGPGPRGALRGSGGRDHAVPGGAGGLSARLPS